jgi:hypothetical protein
MMRVVKKTSSNTRLKHAVCCCAGTIIFLWQVRYPVLRFSSPILNEIIGFVLAIGLPWITAITVFRIGTRSSKIIFLAAALPLLYYSAIVFLGTAMTGFAYKNGRDLSFDQFMELQWRGSDVRLYRTDGGATTDYGVVIRQERKVFPGIMLIRPIDTFYHCYSLNATSTETGISVTDQHSECRSFPGQRREYTLRPHLYF